MADLGAAARAGALRRTGGFFKPVWQYGRKVRSRVFLDLGAPDDAVLLAGMARSGTTWAAQLLNYDGTHRILFEPFHPRRVKLASSFKYIQYMDPECTDASRRAAAVRILAGDLRSNWVDVENAGFVFRRRIVKEVRANLMLRWIAGIAPRIPVVLLVRHPLAVAASWLQLGWGARKADEAASDLEVVLSQPELLAAFPVVEDAARRVDLGDPLQRIVFQWCVSHLVPFSHFKAEQLHVLFYERLVLNPERETRQLFDWLGRSCDWTRLSAAVRTPSMTKKSQAFERRALVAGWREIFNADQTAIARSILSMFGLLNLYASDLPDDASLRDLMAPHRDIVAQVE